MADINRPPARSALHTPAAAGAHAAAPESGTKPEWDVIELLFFAYRDFVGDADEVLARFGFGRAHHRVLHFVFRSPGMKVADLLDVLRITKQSLGRVLKQLVDEGYIVQRAGPKDRRQRLLFVTAKGEDLILRLAGLQTRRVERALASLDAAGQDAARQFLRNMIETGLAPREGARDTPAQDDSAQDDAPSDQLAK